jgi:hypothetical protein
MVRLSARAGGRPRLASFLGDRTALKATLDGNDPGVSVTHWLDRLRRLQGIPFRYLVPNERMLPNESIRFFNLDFNWLFALVEGACSIGQSSALDDTLHAVTAPSLRAAAGLAPTQGESAPDTASGFLLRSQVVAGWPKLEVVAFDASGQELPNVIRLERLTSSILLYVVEGRLDRVILREPAIGLHFGIDIEGGKPLRYVTVPQTAPEGTRPGDQIDGASVAPTYRDATHRTIRIARLAADLSDGLYARNADNAADGKKLPFTSAEFALQLVEGTQEVTFRTAPKKNE